MMQENQLTHAQMEAAEKVAADFLTNRQIADSLGISARTLDRWKHLPAFHAQVKALCDAHNMQLRKRHLADMEAYF